MRRFRNRAPHLRAESRHPPNRPGSLQISTILPKPTPTSRPQTYSVVVTGSRCKSCWFGSRPRRRLNIDVHPGITGTVTGQCDRPDFAAAADPHFQAVDMRWELDVPT